MYTFSRYDHSTHDKQYWWIFQALYKTTVFFKKLVFLTLYLRLFPNKNVTRILWTTIVIVTAGCLAFICITISECNPVPKSWLPSLPGTCLHLPVVYYAWAGFNISTDLWICLIPFPSLHCLRMPLARKVGAMLLFSMSLLTCAISAARTHAVYTALHSPHISACATAVLLWSQVEACVGIMCTCVPSLKAPISRIFHVSLSAQRSLRSTLSSRSPSPSPTPSRNSPVNHKAAKIYKGMSSDVRPLGLFENIDTRTTTTSVYLDSLPSNTLHSPRVAKIRESKERSLRRGTWGVDSVLLSPAPSSPRSTFSRDWPLLPPLSPRKHRASSAQSTIIVSPLTTDTRRDTWGSRVNSPWHRGWSDPSSPRIDHEKTVEELFTRS